MHQIILGGLGQDHMSGPALGFSRREVLPLIGTWECAVRNGIHFRISSLAKGMLFGNFGQRMMKIWKFFLRNPKFW